MAFRGSARRFSSLACAALIGASGPACGVATLAQEFIPGAVDSRAIDSNVLRAHLGIEPLGIFEPWTRDQEVGPF